MQALSRRITRFPWKGGLNWLRLYIGGGILIVVVLLPGASRRHALTMGTEARAATCEGDCNGDGQVTVDEIITMANIALGNTTISACQSGDVTGNGQITVDKIIGAVNSTLNGCSRPAQTEFVKGASQAAISAPSTANQAISITDFGFVGTAGSSAAVASRHSLRVVRQAALDHGASAETPGGTGAQTLVSCQVSGTRETSCTTDGAGNFTFTAFFTGCTFFDSTGTQVVVDGSFQQTAADPSVCSPFTPGSLAVTFSLSQFTDNETDMNGTLTTISAGQNGAFTDAVTPMGPGCNEANSINTLDGDLSVDVSSPAGDLLSEKDYTFTQLTIAISSEVSASGPCVDGLGLNGDLEVFDGVKFDDFSQTFADFAIAGATLADGRVLLGMQGGISTRCFSEVQISTPEFLSFVSADALCPSAGTLRVTLPDGTVATVQYSPQGIDFTGDGVPDVSSCLDPSLQQCPGECLPCDTDADCPGALLCFDCSSSCTGAASRCAPVDFTASCRDGNF